MSYPVCCLSQFCGNFLCDGCRNRPELEAYKQSRGQREAFEADQSRLRQQKAEKSGPFIFLREVAS